VLDSSAHNLWPFELVIAILVGGAVAVAGALIGSVVLWLSRKGRDDDQAG
jgi:ABC-type branched-subunit amino acid transport system permease subunit